MKIFKLVLLLVIMVGLHSCNQHQKGTANEKRTKTQFTVSRGINLSHWLSQVPTGWNMDRSTFITPEDIKLIKTLGFDHVRIPMDEKEMWTEDGVPIDESFQYLKKCLSWCETEGLNAIVDLHILRSHHFNAENDEGEITLWGDSTAQQNFVKLWNDISSYLKDYSTDFVAYELLNEPVADDPEDWNKLIAMAVRSIRVLEPTRTLIIGSNNWQTASNFPFLRVPEGDTNIILSVHSYEPITVTHYKASWNPMVNYDGPIQYPGVPISEKDLLKYTEKGSRVRQFIMDSNENYDSTALQANFEPAIRIADSLGLRLYCGEFGCLPTIPREMRLKYYSDILSVFKNNNMACAAWDYKGDFAVVPYDRENGRNFNPDHELAEILTSK